MIFSETGETCFLKQYFKVSPRVACFNPYTRSTASPLYSLELLPEIRTFQTIIFDALLEASWNANVCLKYLQHLYIVLRFAPLIIDIDSLYGLIMHKKF